MVLPQKLFEEKVLHNNYEQRYGLFHTRLQEVSPVPACEDVGSFCFDKRCLLSIFALDWAACVQLLRVRTNLYLFPISPKLCRRAEGESLS
jgi:hypothetical protein